VRVVLDSGRGGPIGEVEPKRAADTVPVSVDWHDFLINRREPGTAVSLNFVFRPPRALATGFEYKCTTPGVTGGHPHFRIAWPTTIGGTIPDGSVVWTAQAISTDSLRASISSSSWPAVAGLTFSAAAAIDLVYSTNVAGGSSGETYQIAHEITLSTGEPKEALIILPVQD
jgi:hypothetical protein